MSEMVERVARAIYSEGVEQRTGRYWDEADEYDVAVSRACARVAIGAMREPNGEMRACGRDAIEPYVRKGLSRPVQHQWQIADETWRAMIEAAIDA